MLIKIKMSNSCKCWGLFSLILCSILVFSSATLSQSSIGFHGAPFLKISPAARQVAMGEAFSAQSDDINLMRYNVGGLGGIKYPSLAVNFNSWIDDTQQGNVAFAYPFKKLGVIGVDMTYFDEGQIEQLDPFFNPVGGNGVSGDIMLALGYGYRFDLGREKNTHLSIGLAGKYLNQSLVGETSSVTALDAGLQAHFFKYFSLGAAVQNFGLSKMKFTDWQTPLPETYRLGAALSLPLGGNEGHKSNLILASDALYVNKEQIKYYLGSEILISNAFALRGGYKFNETSMSNWATGFGLYIPAKWLGHSMMRLDYAYAPLQAFDEAAHRFSLHFAFGALPRDDRDPGELLKAAQDAEAAASAAAESARRAQAQSDSMAAKLREMEKNYDLLKAELDALQNKYRGTEKGIETFPIPPGDEMPKVGFLIRAINFDFDQAAIRPSEFQRLKDIAALINKPDNDKIHLQGHTDWIGEEDYNINLSQRRIDSVMEYLNNVEKVDRNRFFMPVGYGESRPIADNRTDEGRQRNRRVDFYIYFQGNMPPIPDGSAIRDVRMLDDNTVQIISNGRIPVGKTMRLENPDRFVIDFENIFLLADDREVPLNRGPFIKARLGYHGSAPVKFTRVVLDTHFPIDGTQTVEQNYIIFKRKAQLEQSLEKKN